MLCLPSSLLTNFTNVDRAKGVSSSRLSEAASQRPGGRCGRRSSEGSAVSPGQGEETAGMAMPHSHRRSLSAISTSDPTSPSRHHGGHQRAWSADLGGGGASRVITLRKSKTRPDPPLRGTSLLRADASSTPPSKRHSCPPDSLSLVPPPSCPSSPVVPTSAITGPSPLGCRLRPKSSSSSPRARTARLSLQFPPSTLDRSADPAPVGDSAPPRAASHRRRHSDSFLRSPATQLPVVTDEDLSVVRLRPVARVPGDVVFREGEEDEEMTALGYKVPPPVAVKSAAAKWLAYLITETLPLPAPPPSPANQGEAVYMMIRKSSHQSEHHSGREATESEASCRARDSAPSVPVDMERKRRSLPLPVPPKPGTEREGWREDDDLTERATVSFLKRLSLAQQH